LNFPVCLPITTTINQLGWTEKFFCDWFRKKFIPSVSQHLKSLYLPQKAILLLDNAPSHPNEDILKSIDGNIFVKYLPPNVTALIQLMDQGVIQNMKTLKKTCKN
jgi:hypothetical protein